MFAGCALKGLDYKSIGNTADADLESYPGTFTRVRQVYPNAVIVVPGHGHPGGLELIDHSEQLLTTFLAKKNRA